MNTDQESQNDPLPSQLQALEVEDQDHYCAAHDLEHSLFQH